MRLRNLLAVAVLVMPFAMGATASGAEAEETLRRVELVIGCPELRLEGSTLVRACEVFVVDELVEGATAPTGTVTINHVRSCTLSPREASNSNCFFTEPEQPGPTQMFTAEYSGDALHEAHTFEIEVEYPSVTPAPSGPAPIPRPPSLGPLPFKPVVEPPHGKSHPTPPKPLIAVGPAHRTHSHTASFRLTGAGHFECRLDHGAFHATDASFSQRVSTGAHVLRVRAAGGAGAVATFRWRVLPRR